MIWDGLLYNYGDLCAPVTGGWVPTSTWPGGVIEYRATAILFSMNNQGGTVIGSASIICNNAKTIPAKFTKIKVSYNVTQLMEYALSASVELAICNDQGTVLSTREVPLTTFGTGQIIEIPLGSNQSLPLRVRFSVKQNAGYSTYVDVTKIWAE